MVTDHLTDDDQAVTRRGGGIYGQLRRLWANFKPALGNRVVFAGQLLRDVPSGQSNEWSRRVLYSVLTLTMLKKWRPKVFFNLK